MPTMSIVEDYIIRAIQHARFEHLEDGSVTAWVPGFPVLIALGVDGKRCMNDLWRRLDEWVQASFEEGLELPVIEDIDLNTAEKRKLATYHEPLGERAKGRFFETDEEFREALAFASSRSMVP